MNHISFEDRREKLRSVMEHVNRPKTDGSAVFVSDMYRKDMLYGVIVRAPYPACEILGIDTELAEKLPGVRAVVTAADVAGENHFGRGPEADMQYLAEKRTYSLYDAVALVAADTLQLAEQAAAHFPVTVRELPAVFNAEAAQAPDAPVLHGTGNTLTEYHYTRGDFDETASRAFLTVSGEFSTQLIEQSYLETDCAYACYEGDELHVAVGCHSVVSERTNISLALGIPEEKIKVTLPFMGGSFGGKDDAVFAVYAALLAGKSGRPVLLSVSRKDEMTAHTKRHPQQHRASMALDQEGHILGLRDDILSDTGSAAHVGSAIMKFTTINADGAYRIPVNDLHTKLVYTNNVASGAMRSWGMTGITFVLETLINMAAEKLGMDPVEIRKINALTEGDRLMSGAEVPKGIRFSDCLSRMDRLEIREKSRDHGRFLRGVGYAAGAQGCNFHFGHRDHSDTRLTLSKDGNIAIEMASSDLGEGLEAAMVIIVSETLGYYPAEKIAFRRPETDFPNGGSTGASRQTTMSGNAVLDASENLVEALKKQAALLAGISAEEVTFSDGIFTAGDTSFTIDDLAHSLSEPLTVTGEFTAEPTSMPDENGYGKPVNQYGYGFHRAEVEVDTLTGKVTVLSYKAIHDGGRILNPSGAEGQIQGAAAQGIGMALMEELLYKDGKPLQRGFTDYTIPTFGDVPPIEVEFIDSSVPLGKLGVKGLAEAGITPASPAIIAAIHDAAGIWICDLPATPEKIWKALEEKNV